MSAYVQEIMHCGIAILITLTNYQGYYLNLRSGLDFLIKKWVQFPEVCFDVISQPMVPIPRSLLRGCSFTNPDSMLDL